MNIESSDNTLKPQSEKTATPADKYIWAIYITLCIISIVEQYSASARMVSTNNIIGPLLRHCMHLGAGFIIIYLIQRINYTKFIPWIPVLAFASVVLSIYVMFFGETINGARRSFRLLGVLPIQPAELIKFSAAALIAFIMSKSQLKNGEGASNKGIIVTAVVVLIFGGVLFFQGLTNTIILMMISISMMVLGGVKLRKIFTVFIVYAVLGTGAYFVKSIFEQTNANKDVSQGEKIELSASQKIEQGKTINRITDVFIPRLKRWWEGDSIPKWEQKINGPNTQEIYSYIAQANGGVVGVFPGNTREAARLPLAFSDFIFAIVVEDMGLIGGIFLLILYLSLLGRAGGIASQCIRAFPSMLVIGMALYITIQALFHMGIVSGVFPVSGQPLPLISAGGSSILVTSLAIGVMLSVSRTAARKGRDSKKEASQEANALPEDARAENPSLL
ncbi:MAG: hypothetical protein E7081_00745 [Bacteroidales bacterium]|nr:hypothetical protein [Bacteroidales bacterium]